MKKLFQILTLFICNCAFAEKITVHFEFVAEGSITPAMVCITDLQGSLTIVPPDGATAGPATFPAPFFKGTDYSSDKNWFGPIRKTKGKGGVNQERTYVYGMNLTLPYWDEPVMYQVSGDFSMSLKPGRYRISIEHGNEYIPVEDEFTLQSGMGSINKVYQLQRWINLPARGWYSGDVHAHHASNKPEFIEYLQQFAKAEDVHVVNLLEMGDIEATYFNAPSFGKGSSICRDDFCLVFGQEEPRSDYGHVIGLNIDALARDTANYNHYDWVFEKLHQAPDALVGFAHFAYRGEGVIPGMALFAPLTKIDFVELLQNTQLNQADYYDYLNMGFRIAAAAGSDFPWGSTIGDCRTFVYTGPSFSADAWFKGLKDGRTFVSNGPAVFLEVDGKMPGDEISCQKQQKIRINVTALSNKNIGVIKQVKLYNNDGLLYSRDNVAGADSFSYTIDHIVTKSQWICADVTCENIALAHTSPIYVVADGEQIFDKEKAPAIIAKQLKLLDEIVATEKAKEKPDTGIIERVGKARARYLSMP